MAKKILDIGCSGWKYPGSVGMDHVKRKGVDIKWDLNKFPYPVKPNTFDMVYASHILEHLEDPAKVIEELHRVCKPNGKVIIKVPHASSCRWAFLPYKHGHKNFFSVYSFKILDKSNIEKEYADQYISKKFKVEKVELNYLVKQDFGKPIPRGFAKNIFNKVISGLANMNTDFCERFWCYLVGGFAEIRVEMRVVK